MREYFGKFHGCRTDALFLVKEQPSREQIRAQILAADIIYVGGGNTLQMMRVWRRLGVDQFLKSVYEKGTVLSGISAGAICWFTSGHSDSMSFSNPRRWKYINVRGLGFIPALNCPHYNSRTRGIPRRKQFREMIRKTGGLGIALENNCAILFVDGQFYRVITSKDYARAYALYKTGARVVTKRIPQQKQLAPIDFLRRPPRLTLGQVRFQEYAAKSSKGGVKKDLDANCTRNERGLLYHPSAKALGS